jgi:integrase
MNDQVFILLERLSMQRTSDFVCLNEKGSSWDVNHSARWFRIALEKARVRKVRFHDLRHTFASHFMMNNGNIYDLQKILGHSDMKMTMKYAHLSPEHLLAASNIVSFNGGNVEDLPEIDHRNLVLLKT